MKGSIVGLAKFSTYVNGELIEGSCYNPLKEELNTALFAITQFNSGEYQVKLINKIEIDQPIMIHFDWFKHKDLMILSLMVDAIRKDNKNKVISQLVINIGYLPYARQDRQFEDGLGIPVDVISKFLMSLAKTVKVFTMGLHSDRPYQSFKHNLVNALYNIPSDVNAVFPDENAIKHFDCDSKFLRVIFEKHRCLTTGAVTSSLKSGAILHNDDYMIYDDICDGGRTFIECAKTLKKNGARKVELSVYHAFFSTDIFDFQESGIDHIYIFNKESYNYLKNSNNFAIDFFDSYFTFVNIL